MQNYPRHIVALAHGDKSTSIKFFSLYLTPVVEKSLREARNLASTTSWMHPSFDALVLSDESPLDNCLFAIDMFPDAFDEHDFDDYKELENSIPIYECSVVPVATTKFHISFDSLVFEVRDAYAETLIISSEVSWDAVLLPRSKA